MTPNARTLGAGLIAITVAFFGWMTSYAYTEQGGVAAMTLALGIAGLLANALMAGAAVVGVRMWRRQLNWQRRHESQVELVETVLAVEATVISILDEWPGLWKRARAGDDDERLKALREIKKDLAEFSPVLPRYVATSTRLRALGSDEVPALEKWKTLLATMFGAIKGSYATLHGEPWTPASDYERWWVRFLEGEESARDYLFHVLHDCVSDVREWAQGEMIGTPSAVPLAFEESLADIERFTASGSVRAQASRATAVDAPDDAGAKD